MDISHSIRIDSNVPMETRDGTILRADIYRPDDNRKHSAILTRTPYGKIVMAERDFSFIKMIKAGYAVIFQDIRGRYASEGKYDGGDTFLAQESPDGYDTVEWVSAQPWCDGSVGTAGGSYMARVQWLLAMERPPHLKAMGSKALHDHFFISVSETPIFPNLINVVGAADRGQVVIEI